VAAAAVEQAGGGTVPVSASEPEAQQGRQSLTMETLKAGMLAKGKVRNVVEFGAFIDIGVGRDGLAHISTLKSAGIDKTIKVGDVLDVMVRRIDTEENRISLTIPHAEEDTKTSLRDLHANSVVTGHVVRLVDFGAFVDIGAQVDGLLHVSQMSGGFVTHPSQVLKVGDEIQVRITEVDPRKRRISLSMRDLDTDGAAAPPVAQEARAEEHVPTAFEVAFQKARAGARRRHRPLAS